MKVRRGIENLSLFVLIGLVALRPLIGENYDPAGNSLTDALGAVSDPKPLTTLVFNLLILGSACGCLIARAIGTPQPYRRTGLEWGAAPVAIAAVVSCFFAGNKRLAINATIDWLCYPVLAITLVQLFREPWQKRLLLAAVLASACVVAAQCLDQHFTFNQTWAHYESIKTDFWGRQGVPLDSSKVELFERRMQAREATGFFPHSNVAGSYLVLCFFAGLGLITTQWRNLPKRRNVLLSILCAVATLLILLGVVLTKSLGTLLAGLAALFLWGIVRLCWSWIATQRIRAWAIGWLCVAAGAGAVIGYGLYHGSLPGWSLTFRWQYWQASSDLITDHWMTGVGRENFGRHYLRYKSIESPEEVANPHNLFVQASADWGLLGLIGVVVMAIGASYRLATRPPARSPPVENGNPLKVVFWALGLLLIVTLGRLPLLGSEDPNFLYYSTVVTGIVWLAAFIVFVITTVGPAEASGSGVITAIAVGLFAFLIQDMINFAMFVPGSVTTFFAMLAYCLAKPKDASVRSAEASSSVCKWLLVAACIATMILVIWIAVFPVARAPSWLHAAEKFSNTPLSTPIEEHPASRGFDAASASDPFDPTSEVARAQWLVASATRTLELQTGALQVAIEALTTAMKRDSFNVQLPRMRAKVNLDLAKITGQEDDYLAAVEDARHALELYPLNPAGIVSLADIQATAGEALVSDRMIREAIANYEQALQLDDQRLSWETLHRMRQLEKNEIAAKIQGLRERLSMP